MVSLLAGYFVEDSSGFDLLRARLGENDVALAQFDLMIEMCHEKIQSRVRQTYRGDKDKQKEDKEIFDACNAGLKLYWDKVCAVLLADLKLIDVRDSPVCRGLCCFDLW
jgi:hypothetical protein